MNYFNNIMEILPTEREIAKWENDFAKWKKTRARRYQVLISGLTTGTYAGERFTLMTLTSPPDPKRPLNDDFRVLKNRIERAKFHKIYKNGRKKIKDAFHGFRFNRYFKLHTIEGNGVLHILFRGRYIPKFWLIRNWAQIRGAPVVNIKEYKATRKGIKDLSHYLITQYFSDQPVIRMSYGWKWVFHGFRKAWKNITMIFCLDYNRHAKGQFSNVLKVWDDLMKNPKPTTRQTKLHKGKIHYGKRTLWCFKRGLIPRSDNVFFTWRRRFLSQFKGDPQKLNLTEIFQKTYNLL